VNTLVVSAHPPADGFGADVLTAATAALTRAGHEVRTIDLDGYDARMGLEEWLAYRDLAPRPGPVVASHIADVGWAEQLVFVYPTRWQGLPAVLKGWLERTMVPGVAFDFDAAGRIHGGLQLRRIVGISTQPLPWWTVRLLGDPGRRTLTRALRLSCRHPWRARSRWLALHRPHLDEPVARARFLQRVERLLSSGASPRARARPDRTDLRDRSPACDRAPVRS
jgi:putative NADPH-quinone reductase